MEQFENPAAAYRGLPFWSWNCKITKELIDEQLPIFKQMGFGGVVIHPREGLDTEYLGDEFMQLVKYAVERCREMGIVCWLYDDDRFPSGAADGLVTKNPRFRARQLRLTKTQLTDGYCKSQDEFEAEIDNGKIPKGYYLTAYEITLENKHLTHYRRLYTEVEISAADNVYFAYLELAEEDPWFQGQTYVDTMNPEAVDEFISVTHERYRNALGVDFGKTAAAMFTDEPRIGKQPLMKHAEGGEDAYAPYNEYFAVAFKGKHSFDALDIIPEYIWDNADGSAYNRLIYRDMAAECFASVFMDRICDWCKENGILMTGHILGEETLTSQTTTVGEAMRTYRNMDIPGVDILIDGRELTTIKQASSVAAQNGKKDVMSELYGVTNWDCTFKTYKLQGDWQAALGITKRVPHLSHMSLEGEAKRDWPGSIFYQAPWYEEYNYIEDYFARLNSILTRGKRQTRIAVIHPTQSMWVKFSPDDTSKEERKRLDKNFTDLAEWLLYSALDFDYLSESLLPSQNIKYGDTKLTVGYSQYDAVVVPDMLTIRSTTLDILERFAENGGAVIFAGGIPRLVDGKHSDRAIRFAEKCKCVPYDRGSIVGSLENYRDIEITKADGTRSDNLFYQFRSDGDTKWLFVAHVNETGTLKEEYNININGEYFAEIYDAMTGEAYSMPVKYENGRTVIAWSCYNEDSILLKLGDTKSELPEYKAQPSPTEVKTISEINSFKLHEPNVLLLDYAKFSIDGGAVQEKDEILRAENKIRKQLGFFERTGMDYQPYATEEKETHKVTLYYEFNSEISSPVQLGIENPDKRRLFLNGTEADNTAADWYVDKAIKVVNLPNMRKGKNELVIETEYNQKSFLENIYLLGDFAVTADKVIAEPINSLSVGDITKQGLPFYTGNIDYVFEAELAEDGGYFVRVPEFSAPLLAAYVDGERRELIAYSPHRVSLGRLKKGIHEIKITLYGNRFNSFGMLHNANENYTWYGNGSYRTTGDEWTDDYMLRSVGIMSEIVIEKA